VATADRPGRQSSGPERPASATTAYTLAPAPSSRLKTSRAEQCSWPVCPTAVPACWQQPSSPSDWTRACPGRGRPHAGTGGKYTSGRVLSAEDRTRRLSAAAGGPQAPAQEDRLPAPHRQRALSLRPVRAASTRICDEQGYDDVNVFSFTSATATPASATKQEKSCARPGAPWWSKTS